MMDKMYDLSLPSLPERQGLYLTTPEPDGISLSPDGVKMKKGATIDLGTYFNLLSLGKWAAYTGIGRVQLRLRLTGSFSVTAYNIGSAGTRDLSVENCASSYTAEWEVKSLLQAQAELIGFKLFAKKEGIFHGGAYYGEFPQSRDISIGIVICTYRREAYVTKTMKRLQEFSETHPWLSILVVDNGSTLPLQETECLRVVHNPNYGGSGGFTRGIIENLQENRSDYVLLMDDDIDFDSTVLDRTHSLLCKLKKEYQESFLAGAMLNMDDPCRQVENTAVWKGFVSKVHGKNLDLANQESLRFNESNRQEPFSYGSWWYCAIPVTAIRRIGLPFPMFIKGDDLEYGIRNRRPVINLNGIGVWHEPFYKKYSPSTAYYWIRNGFFLNLASGYYGGFGLAMLAFLNLLRKFPAQRKKFDMYVLALHDFQKGISSLIEMRSDEKHRQVTTYTGTKNRVMEAMNCLSCIYDIYVHHKERKQKCLAFMKEELGGRNLEHAIGDEGFWRNFLKEHKK